MVVVELVNSVTARWGFPRVAGGRAVLVKPINILAVLKLPYHQKRLKVFPSATKTLPFVDDPDVVRVTKAKHRLGPVSHTWMDATGRVNIGLPGGL